MKFMLIYLWIFKIQVEAVRTLTTIDISKDIEQVKFGKHDTNLSKTSEYNITIKPDLKISKVIDGDTRIWQNSYGGEKCTFCHVTNYKKKPVLVMLFIQQFNDFYIVMRFRLFHGTWVPITKALYNEIKKSIADFTGEEFDLEVDINERFNPDILTIHVSAFDHYSSYKLTPAVGYHIDRVRFAQTLLWERTQYQEEVLEIILVVNDGRFEFMSILYETYYETADTLYFRYDRKWEKITREEFFHKPDPPRTLKTYIFPSEDKSKSTQDDKQDGSPETESSSQQEVDDEEEDEEDEVDEVAGRFRGLTNHPRTSKNLEQAKGNNCSKTTSAEPSTSKEAQGAIPKKSPTKLTGRPQPGTQEFTRPWERTHKVTPPLSTGAGFGSNRPHVQGSSKKTSKTPSVTWKGLAPAKFCYPSQVARDMSKDTPIPDDEPSTSQASGESSLREYQQPQDLEDTSTSEPESDTSSFSYRQTRSRGSIYKPFPVYLCDHTENPQPQESEVVDLNDESEPYQPSVFVTSVYPELSGENPDLTNVPDNYMSILEKTDNQLEKDLCNFEEYLEEFDECEFTNKRHKKRKGDSNFFTENKKINTDKENGVTLNLHEIDDSHPHYTIERQTYYRVPVFKITPVGDIHFNCVMAGDKIAWTNHNYGTCHVVKAVVINGRFSAIELIVKRISNLSYLHYKYDKGYYASVHTPTYMTYVTKYAAELYEEARKRAENINDRHINKEQRDKITRAILKEQEEISKECYRQYINGDQPELESGVEPFSLTAKRKVRVRVRKRKKPAEPPINWQNFTQGFNGN